MASETVLFLWPVSVVLTLHSVTAFLLSKAPDRFSRWWMMLPPFLFPFLILLIGGFFWYSGGRSDAPTGPLLVAELLFWSQLILSAFLVYHRKGFRWLTTAVYLLAIWFGIVCWFITGMALTNTWL